MSGSKASPDGILDQPILVTFFDDVLASSKSESSLSMRNLSAPIKVVSKSSKNLLPLLKLARFGSVCTAHGSLRHDKNVVAISGIEVDYDGEVLSFGRACETLYRNGIVGLVYTSPSHTIEKPRWRILCPLSEECQPEMRSHYVARVNGLFDGKLANESFTLSQAYYFGSVNGTPNHRVELIDGTAIDLHNELDATATFRNSKTRPGASTKYPRGDTDRRSDQELLDQIRNRECWHSPVLTLIARQVKQGLSDEEILAKADTWTWRPEYSVDQTIGEMQVMIDGARAKGFLITHFPQSRNA